MSTTVAHMPRVAMLQEGARLHYAIPAALHREGLLAAMYTDWFSAHGSLQQRISQLVERASPALGQRMLARNNPELNQAPIIQSPWLMAAGQLNRYLRRTEHDHLVANARLQSWWMGRHSLADATIALGFVRHLDGLLARRLRRRGLSVLGYQVCAPAPVQQRVTESLQRRWPNFQPLATIPWHELRALEEQTWQQLHAIFYPSDWVRQGLLAQGVAADKLVRMPFPIDVAHYGMPDRSANRSPVTIGFVGRLQLIKGLPYMLQVARRLAGPQVRFVLVGPVRVNEAALAPYRSVVQVIGGVPRSEVRRWLERFDIFYFPSATEGSAGAVMEAMASGLPVVTTPSSGSLVRDGVDGYVVEYDDIDTQQSCLERLVQQPALREQMGQAARACIETADVAAFQRRIRNAMVSLANGTDGEGQGVAS